MMVIEDVTYQPYFHAFILHMGLEIGDETRTVDYMLWNSEKWREWRLMNGVGPCENLTSDNHKSFEKWLMDTIPQGQINLF
ncbi:hypothetical protein PAECIP112173_00396 [Paenibacillus sp. JJ-100]|uniref:hypothetical protein n=1 Tax=Paenibacillus sp. JJ-100 TaxID=2974896 RepID=UPI0022FF516F|nr:hypothetical protein [Paenibacillus sp. JJ-100]CAI6024720.1 hypothetical protein PAECIP112173_00396 [Paenibacillus sp. JJ-100]